VYNFNFLFSHVSDIFSAFLQLFSPHTYYSFPMVVSQMVDRGVTVSAQTLVSAWNATVMFALVCNCAIRNNNSLCNVNYILRSFVAGRCSCKVCGFL